MNKACSSWIQSFGIAAGSVELLVRRYCMVLTFLGRVVYSRFLKLFSRENIACLPETYILHLNLLYKRHARDLLRQVKMVLEFRRSVMNTLNQ